MKDLSITQEFLLCALNNKGKLPLIGKEVPVCIVAGSLIELLQADVLKLDNKKISITKELASELQYLKSIYDEVNKYDSIEIHNLINKYVMTLTDKKLNELTSDLCDELLKKQCVTKSTSKIFINNENFIPNEECVDYIVEKIRAELLEDGSISEEVVALVSLLDKSNILKRYFSKYESKKIEERLKEIKNTSNNILVKQMIDYIESMMSIITVIIASSTVL